MYNIFPWFCAFYGQVTIRISHIQCTKLKGNQPKREKGNGLRSYATVT